MTYNITHLTTDLYSLGFYEEADHLLSLGADSVELAELYRIAEEYATNLLGSHPNYYLSIH